MRFDGCIRRKCGNGTRYVKFLGKLKKSGKDTLKWCKDRLTNTADLQGLTGPHPLVLSDWGSCRAWVWVKPGSYPQPEPQTCCSLIFEQDGSLYGDDERTGPTPGVKNC